MAMSYILKKMDIGSGTTLLCGLWWRKQEQQDRNTMTGKPDRMRERGERKVSKQGLIAFMFKH